MKLRILLTLSAAALLLLPGMGQTLDPVLTPETAEATPFTPTPPEPPAAPEPPQLAPLAPVTGPVETPAKGFPFHTEKKDGNFTLQIEGDDGSKGKLSTTQLTEFILPIAITGIVFTCPILLIAVILFYRQRKNRLMHQTIQSMVEKGQPIPPGLLSGNGKLPPTPGSDRRRGLMLTSIGLGFIFFFLANGNDAWGVGFIPLGIGIGYLLTSKFAPRGETQL